MARGSEAATQAATAAQGLSNTAASRSGDVYGVLAPELESQAMNPSGYSPTDLAAMNTSAQQSAGGITSGATGQAALLGARKRNAGAPAAAIGEASRAAAESLSQRGVETQESNAKLKAAQRQSAIGGLSDLYGTGTEEATRALGIVPQAVDANTQAENSSWNWLKPVEAFGGMLGSGASVYRTAKGK